MGGGGADELYQAIWDSRDSSIVINGSSSSFDYMVTGNHGGSDMWVIKTDKNGAFKWGRCLGSVNNESGNSVCNTAFGYMAYGATDPGNIGLQDTWIFALDSIGDTLCDKQFGGTDYEYANSVFTYKNGYAAVGTTNSMNFTEGANVGHLPGLIGETFVSYINYWPLAIQNISVGNQQMSIYPNPTNQNIRITIPNTAGTFSIINCIGECTYTKNIKQEAIIINTLAWTSGLYIAKWQGENGIVLTKKFIKN